MQAQALVRALQVKRAACRTSAAQETGLQTGLDALGLIPGESTIVGAVQIVGGTLSGGISAYNHDYTGGSLSFAGLALSIASAAKVSIVKNGVKVIPVAGIVVAGISVANDVWGKDGGLAKYSGCMAGQVR